MIQPIDQFRHALHSLRLLDVLQKKMNPIAKSIKLLTIATISSSGLYAQMFELETTYDDGWYSFSFSDGFLPVTFGVTNGSGSVSFNIPNATQITVPDSWIVTNYDWGFQVAYDGVFEVYPLGFETVEFSFFSTLTPN